MAENSSDCDYVDLSIKTKMAELAIDKWPHQTFIQAVFGSLFFPSSVDYGYDSYNAKVNLVKLGCSARFKNPTAIELISKTVSCNKKLPNLKRVKYFEKNLEEEWKKYVTPFTNKSALQPDLPHYRIARLLYALHGDDGIEWHTLGARYDMRCKFMLARKEKNVTSKIEQLTAMWEKNRYLPALSELGRVLLVDGNKELGEECLRKARELQDPMAWKHTAVFVSHHRIQSEYSCLECWERAGDCGYIKAYEQALDCCENNKKGDRARRRIMNKLIKAGSEEGYYQWGVYYMHFGNRDRAIELLKKSGFYSSHDYFQLMINNKEITEEELKDFREKNNELTRAKEIRKLADLE
jgi:tetratricopeptide (TPR) repeat protein